MLTEKRVDPSSASLDLVDGQRHAVERDRALGRDHRAELARHADERCGPNRLRGDARPPRRRASTWPVTICPPSSSPMRSERSRLSLAPSRHRPRRGAATGFAPKHRPRTSRRPCRPRSGTRPSRRSTRRDRPCRGRSRSAIVQPEVAALLGAADGADVGDDPGEHGRAPSCPAPARKLRAGRRRAAARRPARQRPWASAIASSPT